MHEDVVKQVAEIFAQESDERVGEFQRVCRLSEYVQHAVQRYPDIIQNLLESGDLFSAYAEGRLEKSIRQQIASVASVDELDHTLRRIRRREMVRIIARDFSRQADLTETTADLSDLAQTSISVCLEYHYRLNCEKSGIPRGPDGSPQRMVVLALGKLGARELNMSSDIDLVFLYDQQGMAVSKSGKETSNQSFFLRVSRQVISSLNTSTPEGFVFRVDMRLRPYGESGALILHRAAMEKYYVEQGRDWERYAFIKASVVAGDFALGEDFLSWLKPFVYRRHLDYGAIESLREMKRLINRQVEIQELQQDLKLGPGGIREIEFIAQAHQLIFGGNYAALQERRLRKVLLLIADKEYLPRQDVDALDAAYLFLRNSEHAIQGENDKQTQKLPDADESRSRLVEVMGFSDWEEYCQVLEQHRSAVRQSFATLMNANQSETENLVEGNLYWKNVWGEPESPQSISYLASSGFSQPALTAKRLGDFSRGISDLQEIGRERVSKLVPVFLSLAAKQQDPDITVERMLPVIEAISRRSTYLAYLLENADALMRATDLCAMSPWIATRLRDLPILLYELSDRSTQDLNLAKQTLSQQLESMLLLLDENDLEAQMDTLRQFKSGAVLRVAAFELLGLLPVMKASDALTVIAELVLQKAVDLAWHQLVLKYGTPMRDGKAVQSSGFAILAYGKLGGIELAYGSDLDLVFLVDADRNGHTNGEKQLNNQVFYSRLAQRIIHILTSLTRFGALYEVDMRLRPSGNKGPMITAVSAFERYLLEEAWTWEHQALVRARFIAGDDDLGDQFESIRYQVLTQSRQKEQLLSDVVNMREKMRRHLSSQTDSTRLTTEKMDTSEQEVTGLLLSGFDLKHDIGAIVDIEFMVQYAVLAWAHQYPALARWTDKMRLLDEIGKQKLYQIEEIKRLQEAYLAYRSVVHYQWLGGEMDSFDQLQNYRQDVVTIWNNYMNSSSAIAPEKTSNEIQNDNKAGNIDG